MGLDGRSLVTKNDFRILHTLTNMGPSPRAKLNCFILIKITEGFRTFVCENRKRKLIYSI